MNHTTITGTGSYVPDNFIPNETFEQLVETSDEWIRTRTGIERRPITKSENTSDLAYEASLKALEASKTDVAELDLIVVATVSADYFFPGVAQLLQRRLGCGAITAFDVNAACSGFIYALEVADAMLQKQNRRRALVVGAETLSKFTDYTDRNTCVLFGDAAGAVVLERSNKPGIEQIVTHTQGDLEGYLRMESYPLKENFQTVESKRPFIRMNGKEIFRFATSVIPRTIDELLSASGREISELDYVIAHQANKRIIDKAAKAINMPKERMYINIGDYGNTSAASVPLALDEAVRGKHISPGDVFALVAFGAGLTWGGALIQY